jgi:ribosomal protein S18 acetylase RimI-like enzyme
MPNSKILPVRHNGAGTDAKNCTVEYPKSAADDMPEEVMGLVRKGKLSLDVRRARLVDLPAVLEVIDEAKLWLPSKNTDQWSKDWSDQKGRKRSDRVQDSLKQGTTWIVTVTYKEQPYAVATMTIEPNANPLVWDRPGELNEPAIYLSRLVVARRFTGLKVGAALLDWACDHARRRWQAELVRIDVWTRNLALHKYYREQGFRWQGYCTDMCYPSRARFQRSTSLKTWRTPRIFAAVGTSS